MIWNQKLFVYIGHVIFFQWESTQSWKELLVIMSNSIYKNKQENVGHFSLKRKNDRLHISTDSP